MTAAENRQRLDRLRAVEGPWPWKIQPGGYGRIPVARRMTVRRKRGKVL